MADRRGAYALVSDDEASYYDNGGDSQLKSAFTFIIGTRQSMRRRRRFLLPLIAVFFTFSTLFVGRKPLRTALTPTESLRPVHLDRLAGPLTDHSFTNVRNETTYIVGVHHAVSANFPTDYSWIDPFSQKPFVETVYKNGMNNNAMGRLPAGSPYDMLVIGRGATDRYFDKKESIHYNNLTIVGFFANFNATNGQWERAGPEPQILDLPTWRQYPRPCVNLVNGGPADPRFMWTDAGEPLAIIGTSSRVRGVCKAIGVVDLRAAWPGLKDHLEEIGYGDIPIRFDKFIEIGKMNSRTPFEKNWAAFFPGPKPAERTLPWSSYFSKSWRESLPDSTWPLFATQVANRTVVQVNTSLDWTERSPDSYILSNEIDLSYRRNDTLAIADSDCIFDTLPKKWDPESVHQATPFHRVTFCRRGTCKPSRDNTVLLGLIHYKKGRRNYRRMFVTMSVDAPYRILSVSPPLHFGSAESDREVVFSVSMAFLPTKDVSELVAGESPFRESQDTPGGYLSHGWLDDTIVIGAGIRNETSTTSPFVDTESAGGNTPAKYPNTYNFAREPFEAVHG